MSCAFCTPLQIPAFRSAILGNNPLVCSSISGSASRASYSQDVIYAESKGETYAGKHVSERQVRIPKRPRGVLTGEKRRERGHQVTDSVSGVKQTGQEVDNGKSTWVAEMLRLYKVPEQVIKKTLRRIDTSKLFVEEKADQVKDTLDLMNNIGLQGPFLAYILKRKPEVLHRSSTVQEAFVLLSEIGMTFKDLRAVLLKWPGLVLADVGRMQSMVDVLCDHDIGFEIQELRSLVRKAAWVLMYDVERDVRPLLRKLREFIGSRGIKKMVRNTPHLFGADLDAMDEVLHVLANEVGLDETGIAAVFQACPQLLAVSTEDVILPALYFLKSLSIKENEIAKIVRAFPAILLLDVENEMRRVVEFFKDRGVKYVGHIVSHLPPILSYDLKLDIEPKLEYLEKILNLAIFDVLRFPAYFSYSLEDIIIPRTTFLKSLGVPVTASRLVPTVAYSEQEFCEKVARVTSTRYATFSEALKIQMARKKVVNRLLPEDHSNFWPQAGADDNSLSGELLLRKRRRKNVRKQRNLTIYIPWKSIS